MGNACSSAPNTSTAETQTSHSNRGRKAYRVEVDLEASDSEFVVQPSSSQSPTGTEASVKSIRVEELSDSGPKVKLIVEHDRVVCHACGSLLCHLDDAAGKAIAAMEPSTTVENTSFGITSSSGTTTTTTPVSSFQRQQSSNSGSGSQGRLTINTNAQAIDVLPKEFYESIQTYWYVQQCTSCGAETAGVQQLQTFLKEQEASAPPLTFHRGSQVEVTSAIIDFGPMLESSTNPGAMPGANPGEQQLSGRERPPSELNPIPSPRDAAKPSSEPSPTTSLVQPGAVATTPTSVPADSPVSADEPEMTHITRNSSSRSEEPTSRAASSSQTPTEGMRNTTTSGSTSMSQSREASSGQLSRSHNSTSRPSPTPSPRGSVRGSNVRSGRGFNVPNGSQTPTRRRNRELMFERPSSRDGKVASEPSNAARAVKMAFKTLAARIAHSFRDDNDPERDELEERRVELSRLPDEILGPEERLELKQLNHMVNQRQKKSEAIRLWAQNVIAACDRQNAMSLVIHDQMFGGDPGFLRGFTFGELAPAYLASNNQSVSPSLFSKSLDSSGSESDRAQIPYTPHSASLMDFAASLRSSGSRVSQTNSIRSPSNAGMLPAYVPAGDTPANGSRRGSAVSSAAPTLNANSLQMLQLEIAKNPERFVAQYAPSGAQWGAGGALSSSGGETLNNSLSAVPPGFGKGIPLGSPTSQARPNPRTPPATNVMKIGESSVRNPDDDLVAQQLIDEMC